MCFPVTRMVKSYSDAYAAGHHAFHTFYILIVCVLKSLLQVVGGNIGIWTIQILILIFNNISNWTSFPSSKSRNCNDAWL